MKGKLGKLAMPKREEMDISELDMEMPAEKGPPEGTEDEMPEGEMNPLADASDEDLMAEMKKRGLMGSLSEGEGMAEVGEEEYDDEMMG
jgi:hypothetical protein